MSFPVVLPFFRSSIRTKEDIQNVETTTMLLIAFDELKKKENLEIFAKILLPYIAVQHQEGKYFIFSEFLKNHYNVLSQELPNPEDIRSLINGISDPDSFITNLSKIKHLFEIDSSKKTVLTSICSPQLCRGFINLSKFSSDFDPQFQGQEIKPFVDLDVFIDARDKFELIIKSMEDFKNAANDMVNQLNPMPKKFIEDLENKILELEQQFDKKIDDLSKENESIISDFDSKLEEEKQELEKQQAERSNEIAGKIFEIMISHLKSDIELLPEALNRMISESKEINSSVEIFSHATQSLKDLEEKASNILKSIQSTKNAIADERSKISNIQGEIQLKISDLTSSIKTEISKRKAQLNDLISEKDGRIDGLKNLIQQVKNVAEQCIKSIKNKTESTESGKSGLLGLLNSSTQLKITEPTQDQQTNLKIFRFKIPIYYILYRDVKKNMERIFLIPPCVLPIEVKKIKEHAIHGENAKWIAVDPFDKVLIDEVTEPLKDSLNKDVLLRGKINAPIKIGVDNQVIEPQFYSGLKILMENGYLSKKDYKKATNEAIEFFKPKI